MLEEELRENESYADFVSRVLAKDLNPLSREVWRRQMSKKFSKRRQKVSIDSKVRGAT